jgi:hypothetical protein
VETIDFGAGVIVPFYDHDTRTVFIAGKVCEEISGINLLEIIFLGGWKYSVL